MKTTRRNKRRPIADRFFEKVRKTRGCWPWAGAVANGHGSFRIDGKTRQATHIAYDLLVGRLRDGFAIVHGCENRLCVNPQHFVVMPAKKTPGLSNRRKTECPKGHPYDEKNTIRYKNGWRRCRRCLYHAQARHREKQSNLPE